MTEQEREAKLAEMQAASMALTDLRKDRSGYNKNNEQIEDVDKNGAKFLKSIRKEVYMDSSMQLEDRINRQKHYHDRRGVRRDINDN